MSLRQRNTSPSTLRRRILRAIVSVMVCLFIGALVTLVFCAIPLRELGPRWQIPVDQPLRARFHARVFSPVPSFIIDDYTICNDGTRIRDKGFAWNVEFYARRDANGRSLAPDYRPSDLSPLPEELRTAIESTLSVPSKNFLMEGSDLHLGYPSFAVAQTVWRLQFHDERTPNLFVGRTPFGTIITSTDADSILKRSWRILPKPFLTNTLLFAAAPAFLLTAFHTFRFVRTRCRHSKNLCPHCTYPLTGLSPSSLCPECGHAITPRGTQSPNS